MNPNFVKDIRTDQLAIRHTVIQEITNTGEQLKHFYIHDIPLLLKCSVRYLVAVFSVKGLSVSNNIESTITCTSVCLD